MEALFKFLLTPWAGAPLVIWFVGGLMVLAMFTIGVSRRISLKTHRGELALEKSPPAKKKPKQLPP